MAESQETMHVLITCRLISQLSSRQRLRTCYAAVKGKERKGYDPEASLLKCLHCESQFLGGVQLEYSSSASVPIPRGRPRQHSAALLVPSRGEGCGRRQNAHGTEMLAC